MGNINVFLLSEINTSSLSSNRSTKKSLLSYTESVDIIFITDPYNKVVIYIYIYFLILEFTFIKICLKLFHIL